MKNKDLYDDLQSAKEAYYKLREESNYRYPITFEGWLFRDVEEIKDEKL